MQGTYERDIVGWAPSSGSCSSTNLSKRGKPDYRMAGELAGQLLNVQERIQAFVQTAGVAGSLKRTEYFSPDFTEEQPRIVVYLLGVISTIYRGGIGSAFTCKLKITNVSLQPLTMISCSCADVASGRQYAAHGASAVDLRDLVGLVLAEGFQQTSLMAARCTEQQMQELTVLKQNLQLFSSLPSEPAALPDARVVSKFLLQFSDAARKSQGMAELKSGPSRST